MRLGCPWLFIYLKKFKIFYTAHAHVLKHFDTLKIIQRGLGFKGCVVVVRIMHFDYDGFEGSFFDDRCTVRSLYFLRVRLRVSFCPRSGLS